MQVYTAESGNAGYPPRRAAGMAAPFARAQPGLAPGQATVRTYRHGAGDSHLVTLLGEGGRTCRILIESAGAAPADGAAAEEAIVDDIVGETGGHLDLLVDLAGSPHSAGALARLDVGEVWLAWIEDPDDPQARALHAQRAQALDKLRLAAAEVQLRGSAAEARAIAALLAYHGVPRRASSGDRLATLRAGPAAPVYCRPGDARDLPGVGARIYVFGPDSRPARRRRHAASGATLALDEFVHNVMPNLEGTAVDNPFSTLYAIPEPVARAQPFFQAHYWDDAPWRRIDTAWITDATQFGLVLDSLTHSGSLGLAIERDDGAVLLFAPEGQAGAGPLPPEAAWSPDGQRVEGRDLLARTVFYKVGHHGGFDAGAAQDGLALMPNLRVAVIPVERALQEGGGQGAVDALQQALAEVTRDRGYVLRTDQEAPDAALDQGVRATPGYFDVAL
jgi:hypothetical protein